MSIEQAYIDIGDLPAGAPPSGWGDLAVKFEQDAWEIAFSAGLMAAGERVKREFPAVQGQQSDD